MYFMFGSSDSFLKCAYNAVESFQNALTARNEEATHRIVNIFPDLFNSTSTSLELLFNSLWNLKDIEYIAYILLKKELTDSLTD